MEIKDALAQLDPLNDDHWTADGLPRMDVIEALMDDKSVTRKMVTDVAPNFSRENPVIGADPTVDEATQENDPDPEATPTDSDDDEGPTEEEVEAETDDLLEDVLGLSFADVCSTPELMEAYITAASIKSQELTRQWNAIRDEMKELSERQELVDRQLKRHNRRHKKEGPNEIQLYIRAQHEARLKKAERAQAFIRAQTNPKDVLQQLQFVSKLDQAMRARKPEPGSTRPALRMPIRRGPTME